VLSTHPSSVLSSSAAAVAVVSAAAGRTLSARIAKFAAGIEDDKSE